jgi:2,3-dihydroxybenzoate decarboxylase
MTVMRNVRYLDAPECEPFRAMLHRLQVPLYLHPRLPPTHQQVLYGQYPNLVSASYGFGVECAGHALRIMCSGILDKYPVNIILGHCAEALRFIIHRADQRMCLLEHQEATESTQSLSCIISEPIFMLHWLVFVGTVR